MASERIGRVYEALVFAAFESAARGLRGVAATWNPPAGELMVQPDVCLGDPSAPAVLGLVTRAGSRRDWHKKFWRNVGEIVDIRANLTACQIVTVSLGTEPKEELVEVLGLLVDENVFPERATREEIEAWARSIEKSSPADREALGDYANAKLQKAPRAVRRFADDLADLVAGTVKRRRSSWSGAGRWLQGRRGLAESAASKWVPEGSLRRGLAKLVVFGEPAAVLGQIDSRLVVSEPLGRAMQPFGWATRTIGAWKLTDPEIRGVLKGLKRDQIVSLLDTSLSDELRAMVADVAAPEWLTATSRFLSESASGLGSADTVFALLRASEGDHRAGGIRATPPPRLSGSWIFRALMALLKCASGRKQGFGYEQLIEEVRRVARDAKRAAPILRAGGSQEQLRRAGATDSLRRKLVDWASGLAEAELAEWQLRLLAVVLSDAFSEVSLAKLRKACEALPAFIRRLTYEDRVAPYRFFEPLRVVIEMALREGGIAFRLEERHPTLVSEASESARGPGTTPVIVANGCLIHWKSAHGSHTSDKTKELCGRGFSLRHRLGGARGEPIELKRVRKLILVLDGDFSVDDVRHLVACGWEVVLHPTETDGLIEAVLSDKSGT